MLNFLIKFEVIFIVRNYITWKRFGHFSSPCDCLVITHLHLFGFQFSFFLVHDYWELKHVWYLLAEAKIPLIWEFTIAISQNVYWKNWMPLDIVRDEKRQKFSLLLNDRWRYEGRFPHSSCNRHFMDCYCSHWYNYPSISE